MPYRLASDLIVVLHLLFILFVAAGGLLVLRRPRIALLHLPAVGWGAFIEYSGGICPLTPLENHFSHLAGRQGYAGGFIDHYLLPIVYPEGLTREIQIGLGLAVVAVNAGVYLLLIRRSLRRPRQ